MENGRSILVAGYSTTAMMAYPALTERALRWLRTLSPARRSLASDSSPLRDEHASTIADVHGSFPATSNTRLAAAVRLVCCFAAAHIVLQLYLAKPQPIWLLPLALPVLFLFTVYVGVLYWRTVRNSTYEEPRFIYWIDTLWYLGFTAITGGPQSLFAFFLPFPVLFVSLRWGFGPGITMTWFTTISLLVLGVLITGTGSPILAAYSLLSIIALLVLGYLIATWANSGLALRRRLSSLKEIDSQFNPRLNIEQIIDKVVRQLTTLYPVQKYVLVLVEARNPARVFRANLPDRVHRESGNAAADLANVLLRTAPNPIVIYCGGQGLRPAHLSGFPATNAAASKKLANDAAALANQLDCAAFCAIQFNLSHGGTARLFVCSNEACFTSADVPFFQQLGEQLSPRIENVQLLDRLAKEVVEHERRKISRDIHDSAIQPYIGLKFALEALDRKVAPEDALSKDIGRLVETATMEIAELRRYVNALRGQDRPGYASLVPAVRRQAARFGELYGIKVDVAATGEFPIDEGVADEAFHIVSEALSNIRRHTNAAGALISLSCDARMFKLRVSNPSDAAPAKKFTPRSISERALALGGACHVESGSGDTIVTVEIPLHR